MLTQYVIHFSASASVSSSPSPSPANSSSTCIIDVQAPTWETNEGELLYSKIKWVKYEIRMHNLQPNKYRST